VDEAAESFPEVGWSVDQTPVPAELSQCFYSTVISSVGTGG